MAGEKPLVIKVVCRRGITEGGLGSLRVIAVNIRTASANPGYCGLPEADSTKGTDSSRGLDKLGFPRSSDQRLLGYIFRATPHWRPAQKKNFRRFAGRGREGGREERGRHREAETVGRSHLRKKGERQD